MIAQATGVAVPPTNISHLLRTARVAGLLYVVVIICAGFAEIVRSTLVVSGDASATSENILDSEWLFRLGFGSDLVAFSADVALAVALFVLLKPVSETLALLAAFFRLAQAATLGINMLNQFQALLFLTSGEYLNVFAVEQREAMSLLAMEAHSYGYLIGLVFFALSNLVLGYLVIRSGYVPRLLGVGLMILVPVGYLVDSFAFFAGHENEGLSALVIAPAALAEITFALWLLVKGITLPRADEA